MKCMLLLLCACCFQFCFNQSLAFASDTSTYQPFTFPLFTEPEDLECDNFCRQQQVLYNYANWHRSTRQKIHNNEIKCSDLKVLLFSPNDGLGSTAYSMAKALRMAMYLGRFFVIRWDDPRPGWMLGLSLPSDGRGGEWDWDYEAIHSKCAVIPGRSHADRFPISESDELLLFHQADGNLQDYGKRDKKRVELSESEQEQKSKEDYVRKMLFGKPGDDHVEVNFERISASVARVFGDISKTNHWALQEQRKILLELKQDLPRSSYHDHLRTVPSDKLLLQNLFRPSQEVRDAMAPYAAGLRQSSFRVCLHIRTGRGDTEWLDELLIEPWDVQVFQDCYSSWDRTLKAHGAATTVDDHLPNDVFVDSDKWMKHSLFIASDTGSIKERVTKYIQEQKIIANNRIVSVATLASSTHKGEAVLHKADRQNVLRTYAEFFLLELCDAAILTAHSKFGLAGIERGSCPESRRFFVNHANCRSRTLGCEEPITPPICVFYPPSAIDYHDSQCDHEGNPLAALEHLRAMDEKKRAKDATAASRDAQNNAPKLEL